MRSKFFKTLAFIAIVAMIATTVSAQSNPTRGLIVSNDLMQAESAVYIVYFEESAVPSYQGDAAAFQVNSPASVAYRSYLADKQAQFITAMEASFGHSLNVLFQYQLAINGMAVELTPAEAATMSKLEGVAAVIPDWEEHALTDNGPAWIGADDIWAGYEGFDATKGEGIVIGVLDTGINMDHPSFADVGGDGYDHTNPRGQFYGWCNPDDPNYDPTLVCNDKLIGVWSGDEDSPEDAHSHGSHVASIAAGNEHNATLIFPTVTFTRSIRGVAPHANIIAYNIEGTPGTGSAPGSVVLAATEQAIADQVDIINYSFGGDGANPWLTAWHWLNVRDAGIFAVTSAGNLGPGAGTVGAPANAPWILSVASSTHDRRIDNWLVDMTGGDGAPADIMGKGLTAGYGPAPIVYAGWYTETPSGTLDLDTASMCMEPFPEGTFDGEIVVCDRGGGIARTVKGDNVLAGGAGGYVLANDVANGDSLVGDAHSLPGVHITYNDGLALRGWLTHTLVQTATITGYTISITDTNGDIMSSFSSRGPNFNPDILKPDVTAPGQDILGASMTPVEYRIGSGTSQASPHVAGAAALLKVLHPDWTSAQLQTALMTTADDSMTLKEDATTPTDPFDVGTGRVDVRMAAKAGLVLEENTANFLAADPALGGDPTTLNLANFADGHCINSCAWERTVFSSLDVTETWTVSMMNPTSVTLTVDPMTFTLAPGASQVVEVMADVSALPLEQWAFGEVMFTPASTATVAASFPVAVMQVYANLPDRVTIETYQKMGTQTVTGLEGPEITALTTNEYGLTPARITQELVNQDATNGSIFDDMCDPRYGTFCVTEVVSDDIRLVAEVLATTSPDLDMFVMVDFESDGVLDAYACVSATGATLEYCSITNPPNGTYLILVQNFTGSAPSQPGTGSMELFDPVALATAVVPASAAGNMEVSGPTAVPIGVPFDVDVMWDLADDGEGTLDMVAYYYGAFDLGTDAANPANLGLVEVDLVQYPPYEIFLPFVSKVLP